MALPLPPLGLAFAGGAPGGAVRNNLANSHYKYPHLNMADIVTAVWAKVRRVDNYLQEHAPNWGAAVRESCLKGFMETTVHRFVTPYLGEVNRRIAAGDNSWGAVYCDDPNFWAGAHHAITLGRLDALTDQFIDNLLTLYQRIAADNGAVAWLAHFDNASLTEIGFSGSDPHHGNQQVLFLHFGAQRLVYKPRSVNVDAHFVGAPASTFLGGADSVVNRVNGWLAGVQGAHVIPNYRFICRNDYGYVECLDVHQHIDGTNKRKEARRRYLWIMGAYSVISYVFGVSDQHVGNVLICRRPKPHVNLARPNHHGIPYLCNLEIAFNDSMLNNADVNSILSNQVGFLQAAAGAMRSEGEQDIFDRFIYAMNGGHTELTEARVPGQDFGRKATKNLLKYNNGNVRIHTHNWEYYFAGLEAVWRVLQARPNPDKNALANLFNGNVVRYHAIPTGAQLMALTHAAHQGIDHPVPGGGNLTPILVASGWGQPVAPDANYVPTLVADWNRMDVAYYIRTVGAAGVQHVSAAAVNVVGGVVSADPLPLARNRLLNLPVWPFVNFNMHRNWVLGLTVGVNPV